MERNTIDQLEEIVTYADLKVPFFDGKAAYHGRREEIDTAIQNVLSNGGYINGSEVTEFASNLAGYLDVAKVIPCANGTDAITLALMALELEKGDQVIVPTFNFIAAAEAVALLGLEPVFVDIDASSFNINVAELEKHISPRTKSIIVVHLFGLAVDMQPIMDLAKEYNLFVIEDVAQALGGTYQNKKLGTIGHIGCTSFFPTKNLACFGDGGAVFTNDLNMANRIKMLANHGQSQKYEHQCIGLNSRLDTLQAAILNVQLKDLDTAIAKRKEVAGRYYQRLSGLASISLPKENQAHTYNQFCILLANRELRNQLKSYLKENGVDTMIYYPKPNHLQPAFTKLGYQTGDFPKSEDACERILALPIHPHLDMETQTHMTNLIASFLN